MRTNLVDDTVKCSLGTILNSLTLIYNVSRIAGLRDLSVCKRLESSLHSWQVREYATNSHWGTRGITFNSTI